MRQRGSEVGSAIRLAATREGGRQAGRAGYQADREADREGGRQTGSSPMKFLVMLQPVSEAALGMHTNQQCCWAFSYCCTWRGDWKRQQ